jgi:hypothetical protein
MDITQLQKISLIAAAIFSLATPLNHNIRGAKTKESPNPVPVEVSRELHNTKSFITKVQRNIDKTPPFFLGCDFDIKKVKKGAVFDTSFGKWKFTGFNDRKFFFENDQRKLKLPLDEKSFLSRQTGMPMGYLPRRIPNTTSRTYALGTDGNDPLQFLVKGDALDVSLTEDGRNMLSYHLDKLRFGFENRAGVAPESRIRIPFSSLNLQKNGNPNMFISGTPREKIGDNLGEHIKLYIPLLPPYLQIVDNAKP